MMIYISRKENKLILKILISSLINLKEKLKLDNDSIKLVVDSNDEDFKILKEEDIDIIDMEYI